MSNDLIEIARFDSAAEAAVARNRLDDAGIRASLDGEAMASWFWYFGSAIGGVKLLVNRQDAERASSILSSAPEPGDFDSIDFGDDSPEDADDQTNDVSPELMRAFRASIIGLFLFPPLLNIYSTYLLFRHRLFQSFWNWRVKTAVCANVFVFLLFFTIVGSIVTSRAPPEVSTPFGITITSRAELVPAPLIMFAIDENTSASQLAALIEANPSLVTDRGLNGGTLLHYAIGDGRPEIVRVVLEYGCDPNAKGFLGVTPLGNAIMHNQRDIVEMLLQHGANPTIKTGFGTPLEYAELEGRDELVKIIRSAIEKQRSTKNSP